MATYKVIQDIEAEDKLLGPLTLRQFIYAAVAVVALYMSYYFLTHGLVFLIFVPLPVGIISGFFAFPFGRDQPTEIWALAKIRFMLKPHNRIWDQSGLKELVTVTAPRRPEMIYTNNLSEAEVNSRLQALAETIDSRGWVTKNATVGTFQPVNIPRNLPDLEAQSDRLISAASLPQAVPDVDIRGDEDILDEQNNPTAQHFDEMITTREQQHHQKLIDDTNEATLVKKPVRKETTPTSDAWFLNEAKNPEQDQSMYTTFGSRVVIPGADDTATSPPPADSTGQSNSSATSNDTADLPTPEELKAARENMYSPDFEASYSHLKVIKPLSKEEDIIEDTPSHKSSSAPSSKHTGHSKKAKSKSKEPVKAPAQPVTQPLDPAILNLASENNRTIESVAREARHTPKLEGSSDDEVIITLH